MLRRNFITDRPYPTRDALLNFRLHASEITYFLILKHLHSCLYFFFFNDPATPEISPLPLHAALPISGFATRGRQIRFRAEGGGARATAPPGLPRRCRPGYACVAPALVAWRLCIGRARGGKQREGL